MIIAQCRNYHARMVNQSLRRMSDGKSIFKIDYISIIGRKKPEEYKW